MLVGLSQGAWISPIVVALISALGAYLLVVRKASGKIVTTEAGELWREAKSLRDAYLADIKRLTDRLVEVEGRVKALEVEREDLLSRNTRLEEENRALRAQNDALRREVDALKLRLSNLEDETHKMQEEAADAAG